MNQIARFIIAGGATVGLYVGGVWFGTDVLGLPVRPVNITFYILATAISFALSYIWVFQSSAKASGAITRYLILQAVGVVLNALWVEGGLRLTPLYPWVIAATYFAVWPFISFTVQRRFVF